MLRTIVALILSAAAAAESAEAGGDNGETFIWTRSSEGFQSEDHALRGHVFKEIPDTRLLTQCAYHCLNHDGCESFNLNREVHVCALSNTTDLQHPGDLQPAFDVDYVRKGTYLIEENALGLCTSHPCQNGGRCLDGRSSDGVSSFLCVCPEGWTGTDCTQMDGDYDWSDWGDWGSCSASCGQSWRTRSRGCVNQHTGEVGSVFDCFGKEFDIEMCEPVSCPRWSDWGDWADCSTYRTCGPGVKVRQRSCLYAGTAGVDRLCMGPTNESTPCSMPDCVGPLRLTSGASYGEGIVEVYDSESVTWGSICSEGWGIEEADVTCKQLGFPDGAAEATLIPETEGSPVAYKLTGLACSGAETTLLSCQHEGWLVAGSCQEGKMAAVKCIVDGVWSRWSEWGACSVTCAVGEQLRTRECTHPPPANGGAECPDVAEDYKECTMPDCPVDANWAMWAEWTQCNQTCGGGWRGRERVCNPALHGGADCIGDSSQTDACNVEPCPVDAYWQAWQAWEDCSVTCGGGAQSRQRECVAALHGGTDCAGEATSEQDCNTQPCPIDCSWEEWTAWQTCTVTCADGTQARSRDQNVEQHGGQPCDGDGQEVRACEPFVYCPIDCVWLEWAAWGACSTTCSDGEQSRDRDRNEAQYNGADCDGEALETQYCTMGPCPVDGQWMQWQSWGSCSETCGDGTRTRERACNFGVHGGSNCTGDGHQTEDCFEIHCPIDGTWREWESWSPCSETCGDGSQSRVRTCDGPYHQGQNCSGDWVENQECFVVHCPVDGVWSSWSDWGICSHVCDGGRQTRQRACIGPLYDGAPCPAGGAAEERGCNEQSCPEDGYWEMWAAWGDCSLSCGTGSQIRTRVCVPPANGGTGCGSHAEETRDCNTAECPVDGVWASWSAWSVCPVSCGSGGQQRNRTCDGPWFGGRPCEGLGNEQRLCAETPCPIDGSWTPWLDWGACSASCDGGWKQRSRLCNEPQYGGLPCPGNATESETCNEQSCPVDGRWQSWADWVACTASCGGGERWRNRTCQTPLHGGQPCEGMDEQTEACNTQPCPVDCVWELWNAWSSCDVTCGNGTQMRTRTSHVSEHGGIQCTGSGDETQECFPAPCPIPGVWNQWEAWAHCSVSCAGGSRVRQRTCNITSHGDLTSPCEGNDTDIGQCNQFGCRPLARTCGEWVSQGLTDSAYVDVDLDGEGYYPPFVIFCDTVALGGLGVSVIEHTRSNDSTLVEGFEGVGEYHKELLYQDQDGTYLSPDLIRTFTSLSASCSQFVSWRCFAAVIHSPTSHGTVTYWVKQDGEPADYWGGTAPGSEMCACGLDGTCADPTQPCNCDKNDQVWRVDDGFITHKEDLPVMAFSAGDTGNEDEYGFYHIGPLTCYGFNDDQ